MQSELFGKLVPTAEEGPTANTFVAAYAQYLNEHDLPRPPAMGKYAAVFQRLLKTYDSETIMVAMIGIQYVFPYSKGTPWDPMDLERHFIKAYAAGRNRVYAAKQDEGFADALAATGRG